MVVLSGFQGATGGYRHYKGLQEVTEGYKGLQRVARRYRELEAIIRR